MTKLAVVGTRKLIDYSYLKESINSLGLDIELIVSGGAIGADTLGRYYAEEYGIPYLVYPVGSSKQAKFGWNTHGRGAGIVRNQWIVDACDEVVAFPDLEYGKGTQDTMRRAEKSGKKLHVFPVTI